MQKVSKQSLAMIALSILLAISIALTFTFAALSDSKKATGTITFSGNATVTWATTNANTTKYAVSGGEITITLSEADFTFEADGSAKITAAALAEFEKVTVTIKNDANSALKYKITTANNAGAKMTVTNVDVPATAITKSEVTKKLSEIITNIVVADAADASTLEFVVTAAIGASVA